MKYVDAYIFNGLSQLFGADAVFARLAPVDTTMPYHTFGIDGSLRELSTVYREMTYWDLSITVHSIGLDPDVLNTRMRDIERFMLNTDPQAVQRAIDEWEYQSAP